jgi:hypothetical protein
MSKHTLNVPRATRFHQEKTPPGPHGLRLLSTMRAFQRDPLHSALAMVHENGDVVRAHFLFWDIYLIMHPDGVNQVLQENQRNYSKETETLVYPASSGRLADDAPQAYLMPSRLF